MEKREVNKYSFAILGAARSGISIACLLKRNGAKVFISDNTPKERLQYLDEKKLIKEGIEYELGGHTDKIYEYDIIIKSPGIRMDIPVIVKAVALGKQILGEVEAASWFCDAPIIAVTGTNGKTTTTELIGKIFRDAGVDTFVCGNVGVPFAGVVEKATSKSVIVLEVSSFQLENTKDFKPKAAIFTNITPDHIDWHHTFGSYFEAKLNINKNQDDKDFFIYNCDDQNLNKLTGKMNGTACGFTITGDRKSLLTNAGCFVKDGRVLYFKGESEEEIIFENDIFIRGKHNLQNAMCAILAAKSFGIENNSIKNTLKSFEGVEHRIEPVRKLNGVNYYNDSKATNFESTYVALESFPGNIILIMGGKKGDNNFEKIKEFVKERVKIIIAIGQSKEAIKKYFENEKETIICETLEEAVKKAGLNSKPGDSVLFSPAYKSFDMFNNFEHRGEEFKKYVNQL